MKRIAGTVLLALGIVLVSGQQGIRAQSCGDEEAMLKSSLQSVTDLVVTIKKESIDDFGRTFHQKVFLSKVASALSVIDIPIDCLNKAAADSATPKDEAAADKTKADADIKLKGRLEDYKARVKAAAEAKAAKGIIEKAEFVS